MKRTVLFTFVAVVLLGCTLLAQQSGQLLIKVQTAPDSTLPATPVAGAKVTIVHWVHSGMQATLIQDQVLTTNQAGVCMANLPQGTYDVFVSASGLTPAAFRRDLNPGQTTSLVASLAPAPHRLRPAQ